MRVLVVDDEVKLAKLLQRGLRQRGIATDIADSGEEALVRARATLYDAIVLDVMLPGIDGDPFYAHVFKVVWLSQNGRVIRSISS